jgi:hypothetical protein
LSMSATSTVPGRIMLVSAPVSWARFLGSVAKVPAGAGAIAAAAGYAEGNGDGFDDDDAVPVVHQRHVDEHDQIGRNDPCWCGSGKKFKKCHGA